MAPEAAYRQPQLHVRKALIYTALCKAEGSPTRCWECGHLGLDTRPFIPGLLIGPCEKCGSRQNTYDSPRYEARITALLETDGT